jgi:hypothetical protein
MAGRHAGPLTNLDRERKAGFEGEDFIGDNL